MTTNKNDTKTLILKISLAVFIFVVAVFLFLAQTPKDSAEKTPVPVTKKTPTPVKNHQVEIDACVAEAKKGNVSAKRALKTCECFFETAKNDYPKENITNILMAVPNPYGNKNEQAISKIIQQCMAENPPETKVVGTTDTVSDEMPDTAPDKTLDDTTKKQVNP